MKNGKSPVDFDLNVVYTGSAWKLRINITLSDINSTNFGT